MEVQASVYDQHPLQTFILTLPNERLFSFPP